MIGLLVAFTTLTVAAALVLRRELLRHRPPFWEWFGPDDYAFATVTITADVSRFIEGMRRAGRAAERMARERIVWVRQAR